MPAYLHDYVPALYAVSATVLLFFIQFVIADVARIRGRIVPGTRVAESHDSFLFRADRAHANTVENLAAFALAALLAIMVTADPGYVNALAIAFAAARGLHMVFYYADVRPLRSVAFAVGVIANVMLIVAVIQRLASA